MLEVPCKCGKSTKNFSNLRPGSIEFFMGDCCEELEKLQNQPKVEEKQELKEEAPAEIEKPRKPRASKKAKQEEPSKQ